MGYVEMPCAGNVLEVPCGIETGLYPLYLHALLGFFLRLFSLVRPDLLLAKVQDRFRKFVEAVSLLRNMSKSRHYTVSSLNAGNGQGRGELQIVGVVHRSIAFKVAAQELLRCLPSGRGAYRDSVIAPFRYDRIAYSDVLIRFRDADIPVLAAVLADVFNLLLNGRAGAAGQDDEVTGDTGSSKAALRVLRTVQLIVRDRATLKFYLRLRLFDLSGLLPFLHTRLEALRVDGN